MGRTAEHLNGKRGLNATSAFLQIPDVLFLGLAYAAQCRAEAGPDAMLRLFVGVLDMRIIQRELCRDDGELRVAIKPFQTVRRKILFRIPIGKLTGATDVEHARIKTRDVSDAALFRQNSVPKILASMSYAGDWPNSGDNSASSVHTAIRFAPSST